MKQTVLHFDTIGSTNTEALRHAKLGAEEGLTIVAKEQTAGRGRHGRSWNSVRDAGLYFSIILRPRLATSELPLVTLMAGVAVYETLLRYGLTPDIKWVNDVLVDEKKIAGILCEATDGTNGPAIVLGIGINLRSTNITGDLAGSATSIEEELGAVPPADEITQLLSEKVGHYYDLLQRDRAAIVENWRDRSTYFHGRKVRVVTGGDVVDGITDGLEANGALRLLTADGSVISLHAGEVERVRAD